MASISIDASSDDLSSGARIAGLTCEALADEAIRKQLAPWIGA